MRMQMSVRRKLDQRYTKRPPGLEKKQSGRIVFSFTFRHAVEGKNNVSSSEERSSLQCEKVPSDSRSLWISDIQPPPPPITVRISSVSVCRSTLTCLGTDNENHPTLFRAQKTGFQGRWRRVPMPIAPKLCLW